MEHKCTICGYDMSHWKPETHGESSYSVAAKEIGLCIKCIIARNPEISLYNAIKKEHAFKSVSQK